MITSAEYEVEIVNNSGNPKPSRPFRLTFPQPTKQEAQQKGKKRKAGEEPAGEVQPVASKPKLVAESYARQNPGPYPQDNPPENPVRFTPVQVDNTLCQHCSYECLTCQYMLVMIALHSLLWEIRVCRSCTAFAHQ